MNNLLSIVDEKSANSFAKMSQSPFINNKRFCFFRTILCVVLSSGFSKHFFFVVKDKLFKKNFKKGHPRFNFL